MNSFSGARRALEYEIPRQIEVLTRGGQLTQETRRWDDEAGVTETMRSKEMAHDYRYFPEPDLMPFEPTPRWLDEVRNAVVELPLAKKQRFMREYQLPAVRRPDLCVGRAARFLFRIAGPQVQESQSGGQLGHQQSPRQTDRNPERRWPT